MTVAKAGYKPAPGDKPISEGYQPKARPGQSDEITPPPVARSSVVPSPSTCPLAAFVNAGIRAQAAVDKLLRKPGNRPDDDAQDSDRLALKPDPAKVRKNVVYSCCPHFGRTTAKIDCPFCGTTVIVYLWSLAGSGKRCPGCSSLHTWGQTYSTNRPRSGVGGQRPKG